MPKHRFYTLDECPAHQYWLNGGTLSNPYECYLRYAYTIKGVSEAHYANHNPFPRHAANEGVWK